MNERRSIKFNIGIGLPVLLCVLAAALFAVLAGCGGGGGGSGSSSATGGLIGIIIGDDKKDGGQTSSLPENYVEISGCISSPAAPSMSASRAVSLAGPFRLSIAGLDSAAIPGATATIAADGSFVMVLPMSDSPKMARADLASADGTVVHRALLGKTPKRSDVLSSVLKVKQFGFDDEKTAKTLIMLEDKSKIPDAYITLTDVAGSTPFEKLMDVYINDPDGSRAVAPACSALKTVKKALGASSGALDAAKAEYISGTAGLLRSFVASANLYSSDPAVKTALGEKPQIAIGGKTLGENSSQEDVAGAVSSIGSSLVPRAARPEFSVAPGRYTEPKSIAISSLTVGASIRYTLDGTDPAENSGTLYTSPVSLRSGASFRAVAFGPGLEASAVASALYTIELPPVSAPVLTPAAGTHSGTQSVSIICATEGATIRYTLDGSDPAGGAVYAGPFQIASATTVRAVATRANMNDSPAVSASYVIVFPAAAPAFSPLPGIYTGSCEVSISSATPGASIYYTLDGTSPAGGGRLAYTGKILISSNVTLRAVAVKDGMADSPVASASYSIRAAAPVMNPRGGTLAGTQQVEIVSATQGARIKYTLDGNIPSSASGSEYTGPLSISSNVTLKAVAIKESLIDSEVVSEYYSLTPSAALPVFSPSPGPYQTTQYVTINCSTSGATIRYTTNGSEPTASNGTVYGSPIEVAASVTIKARAFKTGLAASNVATGTYSINDFRLQSSVMAEGDYFPKRYVMAEGGDNLSPPVEWLNPPEGTKSFALQISDDRGTPLNFDDDELRWVIYNIPAGATGLSEGIAQGPNVSSGILPSGTANQTDIFDGSIEGYYGPNLTASDPEHVYSFMVIALDRGPDIPPGMTSNGIFANYQSNIIATAYMNVKYSLNQVAQMPVFDPPQGSYVGSQTITISSRTPGAAIKYTTDGSTPSASSGLIYTSPVVVGESKTLKAVAVKSGVSDSYVATAQYTIRQIVSPPFFQPPGGVYSSQQNVVIATETPSAKIMYTIDGSVPSPERGTEYVLPVQISANVKLKAIAYLPDGSTSEITISDYSIQPSTNLLKPTGFQYDAISNLVKWFPNKTVGAIPGYIVQLDDEPPVKVDCSSFGLPATISSNPDTGVDHRLVVRAYFPGTEPQIEGPPSDPFVFKVLHSDIPYAAIPQITGVEFDVPNQTLRWNKITTYDGKPITSDVIPIYYPITFIDAGNGLKEQSPAPITDNYVNFFLLQADPRFKSLPNGTYSFEMQGGVGGASARGLKSKQLVLELFNDNGVRKWRPAAN